MASIPTDDLVERVQALLDTDESVLSVAKKMKYKNPNALYHQLYRRGYKIENHRRLVPIHASEVTA